ncbi:MAG TPA: protein kinase [Nannocystaceae bacterium]|nr:protein kinase [Nannocystaceae bacterium]
MDSDREITALYDAGIEARVERAAPSYDELDANRVLGRVLEGVLDRPVEPIRAGRYVLLDALGQGGLGTVYAAWDPEIDRKVAIKLIRADATDGVDDVQARLRREAQALAKVVHPNVVAIYDVGTFRDQLFLAMELVEGVTLRRWLADAPRDWRAVRDVLVQAGRGLAAVHEAGLVQRDFKPQNVIVAPDGGRERIVKVLDFGLARAIAGARTTSTTLPSSSLVDVQITMPGLLAGTPAYMAPEQCKPGPIDARADQFAFCVTLFEALYGERPFPAEDLRARLDAIAAGRVPTPKRDVPTWLHAATMRGLASDPSARHAAMPQLLDAMQRDLRRKRSGVAIAMAATMSAVATAAAITWWPQPIDDDARAQVEQLVADATQAAAERRFVYPSPDDPKRATAYSSTVALEQLDGPIAEIADARAAELRRTFAAQLEQLGDEYAALPGGEPFAADFYAAALLFDPDDADARAHVYLTPPELADLRARAAQLDFAKAELIAAEPLAVLAEPDRETRRVQLGRLRARGGSSTSLARLDRLVGHEQPPPPVVVAQRNAAPPTAPPPAIAPTTTVTPTDDARTEDVDDLVARGLAALRQRKLDDAQQLLHRAAAKKRSGPVLTALSTLHFELGEYPRAVEYGELAVKAAPKSAAARLALGDAYFKVLRYDEARAAYVAAQKLKSRAAEGRLRKLDDKLGAQ